MDRPKQKCLLTLMDVFQTLILLQMEDFVQSLAGNECPIHLVLSEFLCERNH
jgi:hypothetical protein